MLCSLNLYKQRDLLPSLPTDITYQLVDNALINQSDDNLICLPIMRSINPFCFDAPLILVSKDIGAIEVN